MMTTSTNLGLQAVGLGLLSLALSPGWLRAHERASMLAPQIDRRIAAEWNKEVIPAPLADDATFFRRVHLDLAGRIPSLTEICEFLDDDRPDKRRIWVDRILEAAPNDPSYRDAYVNHFANVWRNWLLAQTNRPLALSQQPALELWLRRHLKANTGYDEMVRDLLTQRPGQVDRRKAARDGTASAFYYANDLRPEKLAASTTRLFLGVKLECAQCHNHPFASWTRERFWEYAAFFTDVPGLVQPKQPAVPGVRGEIKIAGTEKVVKARFLDGTQPQWRDSGTRPTLAAWMTAPDNPFFARAAVNRLWAYFFGVGLVNELDATRDDRFSNYTALLDELAREFVASKYDMKLLIRAIVASQTYQRASAVSRGGKPDIRLLARMPLRGLSPEQLFDSLAVATEYQDTAPLDPRANYIRPQSPRARFVAKFPAQDPNTNYQTSILQALYLMNGDFIADRTSLQKNETLATLADQRTSTAGKVESLYLVVLSRKPRPRESERFVKYVDAGGTAGDPKQALADVFWVLLNSPEFILNH